MIKGLIFFEKHFYKDERGVFMETFNSNEFPNSSGKNITFKEDDISISSKSVLRGLHGDLKNWKLISCIEGEIEVVIVNILSSEKNYKKFNLKCDHQTLTFNQLLIPPGCATGYLCLSKKCIVSYKQSHGYVGANNQYTIKYNDPTYDIRWSDPNPILSPRDK